MSNQIEKNFIPKTQIREYIGLKLLQDRSIPDLQIQALTKSIILKTPTTIFDINGYPLFHDYTLKSGRSAIGKIRAAASKVLGTPVISYQIGADKFNINEAMKEATEVIKKKHRGARIGAPKLVCYSYPKLGAMFNVSRRGGSEKIILDLPSLQPVQITSPDDKEGAYAWSFYDKISNTDQTKRVKLFEKHEKIREEAPAKTLASLATTKSLINKDYQKYVVDIETLFNYESGRKLQFCNHYNDGFSKFSIAKTGTTGHECFQLHAQEVSDYCAVATAQMILCYYRYYYTQDQIAPDLGYTAGNGCPSNQGPGYETLSNNHLDASFDSSPTWEKAKDQIDVLHPLKSGITGHARACAGYMSSKIGLTRTKSLYVYDPWPWNSDLKLGGSVYWEDWDAVSHTNYIYTELQY